MLPVETFTDVVSFLGYYDLGGLKLSSKLSSAVADQFADAYRLFDFTDFSFHVYADAVKAYQLKSDHLTLVCPLAFTNQKAFAEFVSEAFRNCTVGNFVVCGRREHVQYAFKYVAKTIVVAGTLALPSNVFEPGQRLINFVDSFRHVNLTIT